MSAPSPHALQPRSPGPAEPDLRVQLEGAWEVLEQAQMHQSALLERLASWRWRHHLQEQPELLRQVREQEVLLGEALERAENRLRQESWPEHHPLRLLLQELRAQRARVEARVRNRLARLGEREDMPLVKGLERLEARMHEPHPRPLFEGEHVLFTTGFPWSSVLLSSFPFLWIGRQALRYLGRGHDWWFILLGYVLSILPASLSIWRALPSMGQYWLTPRRLVWRPFKGETKQIPLDSIQHDGITTAPHVFTTKTTGVLTVRGAETLTLSDIWRLGVLAALLELHRRRPLLGRAVGPPTYPLAMFPAIRHPEKAGPKDKGEPGLIVMRSGQLAFLPEQGLDGILRALFEEFPTQRPRKLSLTLLMKQLCLLPETNFDHCLEQAVQASGGELWSTATVTHGPALRGRGYQFTAPGRPVLTGYPDASSRQAIRRVLQHWPPQDGDGTSLRSR